MRLLLSLVALTVVAEKICDGGEQQLPVASVAGYWELFEGYQKQAVRVFDTFLRTTWFFKPYDVADFVRLHRLIRFFRFTWNHVIDAFVSEGLLMKSLHQDDVIGFCREIQKFEVYIQPEWCLSVMLLSENITEASSSVIEALALVGASPQNRTLAIRNSLANNTLATDDFAYLYLALNEKPFNLIPVHSSFDDPFVLYRTRELLPSSSFCDYIRYLVDSIRFMKTPLAADLTSGQYSLTTLQFCLQSTPNLDQSPDLDVLELPSCLSPVVSQPKVLIVPVNPVIPPPLDFVPVTSSAGDVRSACSLAAAVRLFAPRASTALHVYHAFHSSPAGSFAVFIRRDYVVNQQSLQTDFLAERIAADWLIGWAQHPLRIFLHNGLRLRSCLDHDALGNFEVPDYRKVAILADWLHGFARLVDSAASLPTNCSASEKEEEEELAAKASESCVSVHRRAVVPAMYEEQGVLPDHIIHVEAKEWRDCVQACAKNDDCRTWTFDPLASDGAAGGAVGSCWFWVEREPEFVVDEKFWLTGNWTCSIRAASARRLLERSQHQQQLFPSSANQLLTAFVQPNIPGLAHLLGDRGRCTNNGHCECFPPFRGPLCASRVASGAAGLRGVLHYLTSDSETDITELVNSLGRLFQFFLVPAQLEYPVVVFHDGLSHANRVRIASVAGAENRVWFAYVENFSTVPEWIKKDDRWRRRLDDVRWSLGYRGMCRFRSGPLFDEPVLSKFEYAMTLDTDGYLPDIVVDDPIKMLHDSQGIYGYSHILDDQPAAVEHFFDHVLMYVRDRDAAMLHTEGMQSFMSEGKWNMRLYMNDIEVVKLDWFRGGKYREFFNYLDAYGGWWLHRWGDHAVRTFAVGMWLDQVIQLAIPYGHQNYCSCSRKNHVCVREHKLNSATGSRFFVCIEP
jgi:hypothetical protein